MNGRLSQTICLERGVLQGSILSPTLFLMVMDPLLRKLEQCSLGPCLGDLYCGAYAHADDIRTIATSRDTLDKQISVVEYFTELNALVLNANKCEVVMVSNTKSRSDVPICTIANHLLAPSLSVKCLGHWWSWDLSSDKAIEEALGKARRCFFFYGAIGAFDGQLNPLSGRAIFEVCVIPACEAGSFPGRDWTKDPEDLTISLSSCSPISTKLALYGYQNLSEKASFSFQNP